MKTGRIRAHLSMKKRYQYLILALLTGLVLFVIYVGDKKTKAEQIEFKKIAIEYNSKQEARNSKIEELEQAIKEEIPGIVAYGDSLTVGTGGNGVTYPGTLQKLIKDSIYKIPVVNRGVLEANTNTIMARAGAVPFTVTEFIIPEDSSKVEIGIISSNGSLVASLDGGINPVNINGVEGIISIEQESNTSENYIYYFQRSKTGEAVNVANGTNVEIANVSKLNNYIPLVLMGLNGGFLDNEDLISQIKAILNTGELNERYLILGLPTGTSESRADLELEMEAAFGDKYLNLREYIVQNGLIQAGLEASNEDLLAIEEGSVPPSLLSDAIHLNAYGYMIVGSAIYEKMNELGYFENIIKIVEELNTL